MDKSFHSGNRNTLYHTLPEGTLLLSFAGVAPHMTADVYYEFYPNRNFVYLTGLKQDAAGIIFLAQKSGEKVEETAFILPPDERAERWNGPRPKAHEVEEIAGITNCRYLADFSNIIHRIISSGRYKYVALDLHKLTPELPDDAAHSFAQLLAQRYPALQIINIHQQLRLQRLFKQPCEIEAMKRAIDITGQGIKAMMQAAKPGMYEYELKAIYQEVLTRHRGEALSFPPIISAGNNNFCIHYHAYSGQINEGDMILNDVGACWDGIYNDCSRSWPVSGKFSERQRLLYECAYQTSEHLFAIIKPGITTQEVDLTIRQYCYQLLHEAGLLASYEEIGKLMWHGGAHHVGYDVHDVVAQGLPVAPGMVFCVDVGIYCEEWGIGFRLEDNCLITENGCINLSANIPRSIAEIEAAMGKR
ncbi:MAG: Xaa-Pro peptidase family protein [Symbiobacteriaceae bacterium]|nr:Xaa-Pro peptidase family protein [Symbiobacteriaceae bacterium]